MKTRVLFTCFIAFLFCADKPPVRAGAAEDEAVQKELSRFEGTWQFVSIEIEGKKVPEEQVKNSGKLVLKGDQFTLRQGDVTYKGTLKVDLTQKPKRIDITFTDGPEKGRTSLGIYELDGDTYKVCIGLTGKDRPTEFASKPGSGHVLEVLKREKANGKD
jgi:uncharacterized protein (TIGR03067 family)